MRDDGIQTGKETGILSPTHLRRLEDQRIGAMANRIAELEAELYRRSHMAPKGCVCWVCDQQRKGLR